MFNIKDQKISKISDIYDDYLDKRSNDVLDNDYFHSNITLSRNHLLGSNFLINLLNNSINRVNLISLIKNILIFYFKNVYYLIFWIINFLILKLIRFNKKYDINLKENKIIIIQTYLDRNSFSSDHKVSDNYFYELYQYLDKKKQRYYILPNIAEKISDFRSRAKILRILSKNHNSFINEYDFFNIVDVIKIIKFIISYPFHVLFHSATISNNNDIDLIYKYDLVQTLSKSSFIPFSQLILGKKLKKFFENNEVKIISWNENQLIHRNFCRGIHSPNIKIYGCQYFMKYPSCRWMFIRENDIKFNVLPNILLVTGKTYLPKKSKLKYLVGSAFRYRDVHDASKQARDLDRISLIIVLPYEQDQSEKLIQFVRNSDYLSKLNISVKIHPDYLHRKKFYKSKISVNWKIINDNNELTNYNIIITKATGSIIEFIAKGFSVLVVKNSNNPLALDPLSDDGKKIIWDTIKKPSNFKSLINKLYDIRRNKNKIIRKISNQYKKNYFKKISEKEFKKEFDI